MILEFSIFKPYSDRLIHGITTKSLGSFNDEEPGFENQKSKLPIEPIFSKQIHGDKIILVTDRPDQQFQADAFITQVKNLPLGVKVADCQGVLMYDPKTNSIAAIHSGWKSSALNIIGKTVKKMEEIFGSNPTDLLVGIGPSLGPCCAQFSNPENELPESVHPYIKDDHVDLWSLSLDQLKDAGVKENQIEFIKECTKCNPDKYYSYRNQDTERMAVFISLRK